MSAAVFASFVCHSLLVFVWGESGLIQMKELLGARNRLESNIQRLEQINHDLVIERDALLYDETTIELRSRVLGYRRPGEMAVSLPSRGRKDTTYTLGSFVRRIEPTSSSHFVFRVIAIAAGAAVFVILLFPNRHDKHHR